MTLSQDLAALLARQDLTAAQKRKEKYDLKGNAIVNFLTPKVGQLFTRGIYTVTLTANPQYNRRRVVFPGIRLTKNGLAVPLKLPVEIVNPAIAVDNGVGGFREDVQQSARDMLMDLAH